MTATIHDVARRAQVSVSTVSRAFTMPELVKTATREQILHAAEELGYRPNRAARGLITGKTGNIGIIVPDLGNPFFPSVLSGAQTRARQSDYAVFLADSGEDPRLESELIEAMSKQVDGVVVCSSRMEADELRRTRERTTVVLMNRKYPGVPAVLMDSADGIRQAVEHLAALGHRRCAFLSGPRNSWSNKERRRGLRTATRLYGVEVVELGPFAPHFEAGLQAADVALATDVTAILAFNDLMALGVLNRLSDRGISVPGDMSVVGFDDIAMAAMCTPQLTTVAMPTQQAGRVAVDLLLEQLAGTHSSSSADGSDHPQRLVGTQLIVRASTAPPRARGGASRRTH
jgi:DNA-binding LacI/PurR family transcriptional regulator